MYGIEVRESGVGLVVELWGEFDIFCIGELKSMLTYVSSSRRPTLVDLSGIAFLDLQSARELAVRSLLYARHLTFRNPSPQVIASVAALGLEGWLNIPPDTDRDEPQLFSNVT